jgi:hypothetical protein
VDSEFYIKAFIRGKPLHAFGRMSAAKFDRHVMKRVRTELGRRDLPALTGGDRFNVKAKLEKWFGQANTFKPMQKIFMDVKNGHVALPPGPPSLPPLSLRARGPLPVAVAAPGLQASNQGNAGAFEAHPAAATEVAQALLDLGQGQGQGQGARASEAPPRQTPRWTGHTASQAKALLERAETAICDHIFEAMRGAASDRERRVVDYLASIMGDLRRARIAPDGPAWNRERCEILATRAKAVAALMGEIEQARGGELATSLVRQVRFYSDHAC